MENFNNIDNMNLENRQNDLELKVYNSKTIAVYITLSILTWAIPLIGWIVLLFARASLSREQCLKNEANLYGIARGIIRGLIIFKIILAILVLIIFFFFVSLTRGIFYR